LCLVAADREKGRLREVVQSIAREGVLDVDDPADATIIANEDVVSVQVGMVLGDQLPPCAARVAPRLPARRRPQRLPGPAALFFAVVRAFLTDRRLPIALRASERVPADYEGPS
jgi:hypothetical protein